LFVVDLAKRAQGSDQITRNVGTQNIQTHTRPSVSDTLDGPTGFFVTGELLPLMARVAPK